jgi:hypothetical protein
MKIVILRENDSFGAPHPYIGMHKMVDKGAPVFPHGKNSNFAKKTIFEENSSFHENSQKFSVKDTINFFLLRMTSE